MKIDGTTLADTLLTNLSETVSTLKKADITPTLAVLLVGDDPSSLSYIRQKQKAAERIGAAVILEHLPQTTSADTLRSAIAHYNNDPTVHGLIVQRPVPVAGVGDILNTVSPAKDVDGFIPQSPFEVPVVRSVLTILNTMYDNLRTSGLVQTEFKQWLNGQTIAVIGRGETAGKPIAEALMKYDCATSIINSTTPNQETITRSSTIVIGCVGKEKIITKRMLKRGVILIAVGVHKGKDGKLHGDYEEADIESIASFYTPTPGGVGPLNVACLMQNLVDACIMSINNKTG